jgi:uncharacterized protein YjaG (DUF416 family)
MYLNKNKLRRVIQKSIKESFENDPRTKELGVKLDKRNMQVEKIKTQLKSFDRSFIIQTYQVCEAIPDLDFQKIVREMVGEMIENSFIADSIHGTVSNMLEILHAGKIETFYIEDENAENDVQMEFAFKTVTDIMENLKDYYVNYFVAIGKGL